MNPSQVYMCSPSCTLLPPPSPYHPSGSSQCTSPMHQVSCIKPMEMESLFINCFFLVNATTLMAESEEELKSLLMKVKKESEKAGLKLNIQRTKFMATGPITSWKIDGETVETVKDFIFLGSKITTDGDYSHEIKRHLLLGRKVMTNLDNMLKSRDITLSTKVDIVKAMVFLVAM